MKSTNVLKQITSYGDLIYTSKLGCMDYYTESLYCVKYLAIRVLKKD